MGKYKWKLVSNMKKRCAIPKGIYFGVFSYIIEHMSIVQMLPYGLDTSPPLLQNSVCLY